MATLDDVLKQVPERSDEAVNRLKEIQKNRAEKKRKRREKQAEKNFFRNTAIFGAVATGAGIGLGYLTNVVEPVTGGLVAALTVGMGYALGKQDDSVSPTFIISALAIAVLAAEFVAPGWLVEPIAESVLGLVVAEWFAGWNAVDFAVLSAVSIVSWWIIDIRLISRSGVKASTVAKRLRDRKIQPLIEEYLSIVRLAIVGGFLIGFVILNQIGMIAGEVGGYAGDAPYLAADLATMALGFLALGGDVPFFNGIPFLEEIGSIGWIGLTGIVLAVAVVVDNAD